MKKMNSVKKMVFYLFWMFFLNQNSFATQQGKTPILSPRRISSKLIDLGKVHPIYMTAGMATIIELPGPVTGVRTGSPQAISYFQPENPKNEVTVVLQAQKIKPTNLILRSGSKKYVFDIIPSVAIHQDTVEILGDYGGASLDDANAQLIDSGEIK